MLRRRQKPPCAPVAFEKEPAEQAFGPEIFCGDAVAAEVAIRSLMRRHEVEQTDRLAKTDDLDGLADCG